MTAPRYNLNSSAFRRHVLQADFMVAEMAARGDRILEGAEVIAPERTGAYRSRFRKKTRKRGGIHKDRAECIVYNTDPAALSIEFGHTTEAGTHVEGHYTLTQAIDAARY